MKKHSSGATKPLTNGRFKTRRALVNNVMRLRRKGQLNLEEIGEACGVSRSTAYNIIKRELLCAS